MTAKQLFNIIDGADDKFLKEAMEDDIQYPAMLAQSPDSPKNIKRRSPKKAIAIVSAFTAAALCLTALGGILIKSKLVSSGKISVPFASITANRLINSKLTADVDEQFELTADLPTVQQELNGKYSMVSAEITLKFDPEMFTELGEIPVRLFAFSEDNAIVDLSLEGITEKIDLDDLTNDLIIDKVIQKAHPDGEIGIRLSFRCPSGAKQYTFAAVLFPGEMCAVTDTLGRSPSLLKAVTVESGTAEFGGGFSEPEEPVLGAAPRIVTNKVTDGQVLYPGSYMGFFCDYVQGQNDYFLFALYDGRLFRCFSSNPEYLLYSGYTHKVTERSAAHDNGAFYYGLSESSFKTGAHTLQLVKVPILKSAAVKGGTESGACSARYLIDADETRNINIKYAEEPGMKITVMLDKHEYNTNEDIRLTAVVKNLSEHEITLCTPSSFSGARYGKLHIHLFSDQFEIGFVSFDNESAESKITLKPNEEYVLEAVIKSKSSKEAVYYGSDISGSCTVCLDTGLEAPADYTSFSVSFKAAVN